ncbi:MAG: hypothetical protein IT204_04035 [Fimbriimonadaceae bacterium]|nr:hypothetical protein [Fimbriimonadaceae bacterium]
MSAASRLGGVWILLLLAATAVAAAPLAEELRDADGRLLARLDWTTRQLTATGKARLGRPTALLERAARGDAYANLALLARRVRVDAARRVQQIAAEPAVATHLEAYIRYAQFGTLRREGGFAYLDASVPLFGISAGGETRYLGSELYQRDDVWAHEVLAAPPLADGPTGVVLDARELAADGSLAPVVRDTTGRVVWHVECADRELAIAAGAVQYLNDLDEARRTSRAGERPLVLAVAATVEGDLVVSEAVGQMLAPPAVVQPVLWLGGWIRTITPVSPFRRICCVSTAPRPAPPAKPAAPAPTA